MSLPDYFFERVTADIRQQMDGVLALAEQLGRGRLSPDASACVEGVADAAASVRRMLDCATDLKAVVLTGLTVDAAPLALRELMDEVQARWQPKATQTAVTLLVSYDGDPEAAVMADRARLLQIFDGFLGEAISSRSRGAVEVGVHAVAGPDGVTLNCRVRGVRDAAWDLLDVEERIKSIDERLGLEVALSAMLARRILHGMNGEVLREGAAGVSETAHFVLTLPAAVAAAPEAQTAQTASARAAHILVVDDNATNRMVAQSLVEMFDCTSESAEDGVEAVEAARSGRFDLILMDIRMPRMDGVAATRAIRALKGPVSAVPIIALTANADPEDAAGYLAAGMNGVVEKPMKPEHLLNALQSALRGAGQPEAGGSKAAAA